MIRNYKEEYSSIRRTALDIVKTADDPGSHILHISFTKYGKGVHQKENRKFLDDTELDFGLGILDKSEYEQLKMAHNIIERSIENGSLY